MLQQIRSVRQDDPSRQRCWFQDDYLDLFVWTDASGAVVAFQLCYDRSNHERILAWSATAGSIHRRVDDGEQTPVKNMSPIMVADGQFGADAVGAEFQRRGMEIDLRLRDFIRGKIDEAAARLTGSTQ
jgi:hypothetical protein